MQIQQIYNQYKILPMLQEHMFRVASVVAMIAENMEMKLDSENMICAGLLHDMGNILKFNLTLFPEAYEEKGVKYWTEVQKEYEQKYGRDEHIATEMIAQELGVSERILELVNSYGFGKVLERLDDDNFGNKISLYSDHRVAPGGIMSLLDRIVNGRKRYVKNKNITQEDVDNNDFEALSNAIIKLESQIFDKCNIKPSDITDESISPYLIKVKEINI